MPYPHKNSDGVIPASKNSTKFSDLIKAELENMKKTTALDMEAYEKLLKQNAAQYKPQTFPTAAYMTAEDKKKAVLNMKKYGLLPPNWEYVEDIVLIPAAEKPSSYSIWDDSPSIPSPKKMHTIHLTTYVDIPGLPSNNQKISASWALDPSHSYTEAELRAKLEASFGQMTSHIIEALKENKK